MTRPLGSEKPVRWTVVAAHLTVLELRSYRNVAYRHALPPPLGAGNDCRNGRSWSTAGASEEAGGRAGWGLQADL